MLCLSLVAAFLIQLTCQGRIILDYIPRDHVLKGLGATHSLYQFYSGSLLLKAIHHGEVLQQNYIGESQLLASVSYKDAAKTRKWFQIHDIDAHVTFSSAVDNLVSFLVYADQFTITALNESTITFISCCVIPSVLKADTSVSAVLAVASQHAIEFASMTTARGVATSHISVPPKALLQQQHFQLELKKRHPINQHVEDKKKIEIAILFRPIYDRDHGARFVQEMLNRLTSSSSAQAIHSFDTSHAFWLFSDYSEHESDIKGSDGRRAATMEARGGRASTAITSKPSWADYNTEGNPWHMMRSKYVLPSSILAGVRAGASAGVASLDVNQTLRKQPKNVDKSVFDSKKVAYQEWRRALVEIAVSSSSSFSSSPISNALVSYCGFDKLLNVSAVKHRQHSVHLDITNSMVYPQPSSSSASLIVRSSACFVLLMSHITADASVSRVGLSAPIRTQNNVARGLVQSGVVSVETMSDLGLDGTDVVIGISDTGIDENSCFFQDKEHGTVKRSDYDNPYTDTKYRKVIQYIDYSESGGDYAFGHGSHTAGTLAGECVDSSVPQEQYHGMAKKAKIAFFDIGVDNDAGDLIVPWGLDTDLYPTAYSAGAHIHSNSWGGGYWYDGYSIESDRYLYNTHDFLLVFAGGNDGSFGSETVLSPGLSKNSLAVAATYNEHTGTSKSADYLAYFSAQGPAPDGRIKPDIAAPGFALYSAMAHAESENAKTCDTSSKSGTSMATPTVAGNLVLIQQYFEDDAFWASWCNPKCNLCLQGAFTPSGPLMKALALHSGKPMIGYVGSTGKVSVTLGHTPDTYQGYGRLVLTNILPVQHYSTSSFQLFVDEGTLTVLTELEFRISVSSAAVPLRVTICWFDPPNSAFVAKVLLHDLDLVVYSPNGDIFYGNAGIDSSTGLPQEGQERDDLNTNEQVTIASPAVGAWTVKVQAKSLTEAVVQRFSVVITSDGAVEYVTTTPVAINPKVLSLCLSDSPDALMQLNVAKWSKIMVDGWHQSDFYSITVGDGGNVTGYFVSTYMMYDFDIVCLESGRHAIALNLVNAVSHRGTQLTIPQCGNVLLAPLCPRQDIYIQPAELFAEPNGDQEYTDDEGVAASMFYRFNDTACRDYCQYMRHAVIDIQLSEEWGAGWTGSYYAIHRAVGNFDITDDFSYYPDDEANYSPAMLDDAALLSHYSAGSGALEWGFIESKRQCLRMDTFEHESENDEPICYFMQMSVPYDTEEEPLVTFSNSFLATQSDKESGYKITNKPCPYQLSKNITLAVFCVDPNNKSTFVTFHQQPGLVAKDFGQRQTTWEQLADSQAIGNRVEIGVCTLEVPVLGAISAGDDSIDDDSADEDNGEYALGSIDGHSFSCFSDCEDFPGTALFQYSLGDMCYFLLNVFNKCDTYSVAYGLCVSDACVAGCSVQDLCYYSAGGVTSCPDGTSWNGLSPAASELYESCVVNYVVPSAAYDSSNPGVSYTTEIIFIVGVVLSILIVMLVLMGIGQHYARKLVAQQQQRSSNRSAASSSGDLVEITLSPVHVQFNGNNSNSRSRNGGSGESSNLELSNTQSQTTANRSSSSSNNSFVSSSSHGDGGLTLLQRSSAMLGKLLLGRDKTSYSKVELSSMHGDGNSEGRGGNKAAGNGLSGVFTISGEDDNEEFDDHGDNDDTFNEDDVALEEKGVGGVSSPAAPLQQFKKQVE